MLDLDPLHLAVAAKLDHRVAGVPGIVEEERPIAPDRLELVSLGERRPAVEQPKTSPGKLIVPVKTQSVPLGPTSCCPYSCSGSPASRRDPLTQ